MSGAQAAPAAVLAIDGGNSKTDVALVSADGAVLAHTHGPGSNAQGIGLSASMRVLRELVERAACEAGHASARGIACHTAAYLAGVDVPQEEEAVGAAVRAEGWSPSTTVDNDTFAVFRAGTTSHWGIGVVAGAGVNAVGIGPDGRVVRFTAIGEISGDRGGGGELSRRVMWHAMRDEDGRGAPTMLRQMVIDRFGLPSVQDVVVALHLGELTLRDLHSLTRVLFAAAAAGDHAALSLVDDQAHEVALLAKSAMRRLDLMDTPTDVILGGGLLTARDPVLSRRVEEWMGREAPTARVRVNEVPAIAGAVLLGLDHIEGASSPGGVSGTAGDAERRVRAALRPASLGPASTD